MLQLVDRVLHRRGTEADHHQRDGSVVRGPGQLHRHGPRVVLQGPARLSANQRAVDAFATATVRMYRHFEARDPAPWRKSMTDAVTAWAEHRGLPA
jgi:hypothetical protein